MFVGKFPGKEEVEQRIPMVGPSGKIIRSICSEVGININEVYLANLCKYQPPFGKLTEIDKIGISLHDQIEELKEEIERVRPNVVLLLGEEPLHAFTGFSHIYNYRGSILTANFGRVVKVIPTIHTAALIPNKNDPTAGIPWVWREVIKHDFRRCLEESYSPDCNYTARTHSIASNSLDVYRFHEEYRSLGRPACDIESINCIPVSIAFAYHAQHSLTIPLLGKIGPHRLTDMTTAELAECWKIIQEILLEGNLVGQNFKYDEFKLRLAWFIIGKLLSDTLLKTHTIWPELPNKQLSTQSSLWTREPYYKEEGKEPKIGKFNIKQFFIYNGKDACVTKEIDDVLEVKLDDMATRLNLPLKSFYYDYVMKKHSHYLAMENRGLEVDHARKAELKARYEMMYEREQDRLNEYIGHPVNVKSVPQVGQLLYKEMGFKVRLKDPTSEDTIVALLGNHCKGRDANEKKKVLNQILEVRRIRDQLSRQINFVQDYDGRCRTSYKITGTETARTSTKQLKPPVRPKKIGLPFHTISKHGRLGRDISSMFKPDRGKVAIKADASQAEPRIVAVLSEDWKLIEVMQAGKIDIHRRTAAMIFGYTSFLDLEDHVIKADSMEKDGPERYTGKTTRNAGNYDVGKHTFMETYNTNAQKYEINADISEWRAGQMLDLFHKATPKVRSVFHRDIKAAIDENRILVNPFGRPREFYAKIDDAGSIYKEGYAHIPQSTVADLVQGAAIKIDEEIDDQSLAYWVSENHDALIYEAPIGDWERYAILIKKHMMAPIDFRPYCTLKRDYTLVIPCDVELCEDNFSNFKKVKVA